MSKPPSSQLSLGIQNLIFFRIDFWRSFFRILPQLWDHFLDVFFTLFLSLFRDLFLNRIFSLFHFLSFCANPRRHAFYCSPLVFKRFHPFRKRLSFHEHLSQNTPKISFVFVSNFHKNSRLFRHRFSHRFVHRCLMEDGSQN